MCALGPCRFGASMAVVIISTVHSDTVHRSLRIRMTRAPGVSDLRAHGVAPLRKQSVHRTGGQVPPRVLIGVLFSVFTSSRHFGFEREAASRVPVVCLNVTTVYRPRQPSFTT